MSIVAAINDAFKKAKERNWDTLYFAIDVHDTIIPSDSTTGKEPEYKFEPAPEYLAVKKRDCKHALQLLSNIPMIKIILFTSSYQNNVDNVIAWLKENDINVDFFNENPECENTKTGCFDKKFFYNVLIDDKAGFSPAHDWAEVIDAVQSNVMSRSGGKEETGNRPAYSCFSKVCSEGF